MPNRCLLHYFECITRPWSICELQSTSFITAMNMAFTWSSHDSSSAQGSNKIYTLYLNVWFCRKEGNTWLVSVTSVMSGTTQLVTVASVMSGTTRLVTVASVMSGTTQLVSVASVTLLVNIYLLLLTQHETNQPKQHDLYHSSKDLKLICPFLRLSSHCVRYNKKRIYSSCY